MFDHLVHTCNWLLIIGPSLKLRIHKSAHVYSRMPFLAELINFRDIICGDITVSYIRFCIFFILTVAAHVNSSPSQQDHSVAAYCLLPGKTLHLSALLNAKRFRDKGNKEGAVRAFKLLQEAGLGKVIETKPSRGATMVCIYDHGISVHVGAFLTR